MRKILLATTALIGFAATGAAQAATAPLNVTVGGRVDFVAGAFHESRASGATNSASGDFETIYSLDFAVAGKASNGIDFGGNLVLDNDIHAGGENSLWGNGSEIAVSRADIFMSGAYGKLQMGDNRGVTELAVTAPSIGGVRYIDFLDTSDSFPRDLVVGIDGKDHSTNASYYTPKFGNELGKVQAAVTYVPNFSRFGSQVQLTQTTAYKNVIKGVLAYEGNIKSVAVDASANVISGNTNVPSNQRAFTAWGFGAKAAYQGFTLGANYVDQGHYFALPGSNKDQQQYSVGLKYDTCCKFAVAFNYFGGEGYSDYATDGYVKTLNVYNFGGAYMWAPGLTTTANAILFNQETDDGTDNDGYVLLVSQKLAF